MIEKVTELEKNSFLLKQIKACLFDFDGVIVDSEILHAEMKQKALDNLGVAYSKDIFAEFQGRPDLDFFNYVVAELAPTHAMSAKQMLAIKYQLYREHIDQLTLINGIQEVLNFSKQQCDYTAIVTSSVLIDVRHIIDNFFTSDTFDYIVSCEDTVRHKPHPDPYNKAIALCGLKPAQCLVIEDSPSGVRAAKKAGCVVVAITTTFSSAILEDAQADIIVRDYRQLLNILNEAIMSTKA
ncbi:MAG: HAD family phosphatase [Oceanospirillaceae bacterium]